MKNPGIVRMTKLLVIAGLGGLALELAAADWQVVMSNEVSGSVVPATNLLVRKMTLKAIREDQPPVSSWLFFTAKQEQVFLNHIEKTFCRLSTQSQPAPSPAPPVFAYSPEKTNLDGQPVEVRRWTNGPAWGSTWTAPAAPFLAGITNPPTPAAGSVGLSPSLAVGSLVDSNTIVLATEYGTTAVAQPPAGAADSNSPPADFRFIIRSTLVSLTPTNFGPSEFEIPTNYTEIHDLTPRPVAINPEIFGHRATGTKNLERLRKAYQEGKPVLQIPNIKPLN